MEQKEALVQFIMYNRCTGDKTKISKQQYNDMVASITHLVKVKMVKQIINEL